MKKSTAGALLTAVCIAASVIAGCGDSAANQLSSAQTALEGALEQRPLSYKWLRDEPVRELKEFIASSKKNASGPDGRQEEQEQRLEETEKSVVSGDGYGEADEYDRRGDAPVRKQGESMNIVQEKDLPEEVKDNLSKYGGDYFTFIGYETTEVSGDFPGIVVSNLAENKFPMRYRFVDGDTVLYETALIQPGQSIVVDVYSFLGEGENTIDLQATAYTNDGTVLNSLSQSVLFKVTGGGGGDSTTTSGMNGSYDTVVIYETDTTCYYVTLPAVLSVEEGRFGVSFNIGIKPENLKRRTELAVVIDNAKLNGNDVVSSVYTSELVRVGYGDGTDNALNDEFLNWFGPVYAVIRNGKAAGVNYHDNAIFRLEVR